MPNKEQSAKCLEEIQQLYDKVLKWKVPPFAKHGMGLLKQKYIKRFHEAHPIALFADLKKEYDP